MTNAALIGTLLLLAPAGVFGACLPVIRELGRPTRIATALLCGAVVMSVEVGILTIAGVPLSLPAIFVPLVTASLIAGRFLCGLPASPGPENAYPGFPAALVVLVSTACLVATLAAGRPAVAPDALVASSVIEFRSIPPTHVVPGETFGLNPGSASEMALPLASALLPALWLLVGLPILAALLALHVPLRRGWEVAAIWYAAIATSFVVRPPAGGGEAIGIVFATIAALAAFGSRKEPRLVPFASIMLCGSAMTGREAMVVVVAILAGTFVRDIEEGGAVASRRLGMLLLGPAVAVSVHAAEGFARLGRHGLPSVEHAFPGSLATGLFGLSWVFPLLVVVAMQPGNLRRIASLLPILAPGITLATVFVLDVLQVSGEAPGSGAANGVFVACSVLSMVILAGGLSLRAPARHTRHSPRPVPAR